MFTSSSGNCKHSGVMPSSQSNHPYPKAFKWLQSHFPAKLDSVLYMEHADFSASGHPVSIGKSLSEQGICHVLVWVVPFRVCAQLFLFLFSLYRYSLKCVCIIKARKKINLHLLTVQIVSNTGHVEAHAAR